MEIIISSKSKKPIYDQIASQIKGQILSGKLKEGDSLPAMRPLAKSLKVSVITVQKAYESLQREGFIDSAVGRGTFVAECDTDKVKNDQLLLIEEQLRDVIQQTKKNGIELSDVVLLFETLIKEET